MWSGLTVIIVHNRSLFNLPQVHADILRLITVPYALSENALVSLLGEFVHTEYLLGLPRSKSIQGYEHRLVISNGHVADDLQSVHSSLYTGSLCPCERSCFRRRGQCSQGPAGVTLRQRLNHTQVKISHRVSHCERYVVYCRARGVNE